MQEIGRISFDFAQGTLLKRFLGEVEGEYGFKRPYLKE